MDDAKSRQRQSIELARLRPTQLSVGMLEVKLKRRRLRKLKRRPAELVDFILELPIRVVLGPAKKVYVIDHHHLALALLKEKFETAPMDIEADFSRLPARAFWNRMQADHFLHLFNAKGTPKPLGNLPKCLEDLKDDPYRSLAGFVRVAGGYEKTAAPYAEFQWADFFRTRISAKSLRKQFDWCVKRGVRLARSAEAADLPGYVQRSQR
jgi:hypothetical protein